MEIEARNNDRTIGSTVKLPNTFGVPVRRQLVAAVVEEDGVLLGVADRPGGGVEEGRGKRGEAEKCERRRESGIRGKRREGKIGRNKEERGEGSEGRKGRNVGGTEE